MSTRTIEARKNNAYTTILLIEDGKVISEWITTGDDEAWANYLNLGDLDDWENTQQDGPTDPAEWGDLIGRIVID